MKKIILFALTLICFSFTNEKSEQNTVYVCGNSKVYHYSDSHTALSKCKSGITKFSESKAKANGLRVCKCKN